MQRLAKAKLLLTRTQLRQLKLQTNQAIDDNDEYVITSEDLDLHRGYSRPELVEVDDELPQDILDRLADIRAMAVNRHQEVWGS